MQDKIKPCAHCNFVALLRSDGKHPHGGYFIICQKCYASSGRYNTPEEAITGWNQRATDKTIEALVVALKEAKTGISIYYDAHSKLMVDKIEAALASVEGV